VLKKQILVRERRGEGREVKWSCLAKEDAPDMANLWRELELAPGHGSLAG
jgi:hypothetical protein